VLAEMFREGSFRKEEPMTCLTPASFRDADAVYIHGESKREHLGIGRRVV
jgi:hypothetical protein